MRVLLLGGYDSTNHVFVELVRELERRGHACTIVVGDEHDRANVGMFTHAGMTIVPARAFDLRSVGSYDLAFSGPFVMRPLRRLYDRVHRERLFLIAWQTLFSSVTMRVAADMVLTSSAAKFDEFERSGLDYSMVAVGNPQYDPLIRARAHRTRTTPDAIRSVLIVEQGAYPLGAVGKRQLAQALTAAARTHPHLSFTVKARYAPGETGRRLHPVNEHLFDHLADAPANLRLHAGVDSVEELVLEHDAMVTMWSTAHLDAAVLGIPLILVSGLDSSEVYDVRSTRVRQAYDRLRETGCVVDWRQLAEGELPFSLVRPEYLRRELEHPDLPAAPRVAEFTEALVGKVLRTGRTMRVRLRTDLEGALAAFDSPEATTIAGSPEDVLARQLRRETNRIVQEFVFENRCMGNAFDVSSLLEFMRREPDVALGERGVDRYVAELRQHLAAKRAHLFEGDSRLVAEDAFVQDAYFDWLRRTKRYAQLISYAGQVACPEGLAYNRGLALMRRGRLVSAGRNLAASFSMSLRKPVRETRKDRNVEVTLDKCDRSLLAHAVLMLIDAYGEPEALAYRPVPKRPHFDALVYYRMRALVRLGRMADAVAVNDSYDASLRSAASEAAAPSSMTVTAISALFGVARRRLRARCASRTAEAGGMA